jgi:hypothetical protein
MDVRIKRIMKREGIDKDTASWFCEKTDRERSCFTHSVYGRRWDEPSEYDAVLDAGRQSIDELVQLVNEEFLKRERFTTPEVRRKLVMLACAAKVRAGITMNQRFFIPTLDMFYDGTEIVLRGVSQTPKEHKRIEDAAKELAGGMLVRCELNYRQ